MTHFLSLVSGFSVMLGEVYALGRSAEAKSWRSNTTWHVQEMAVVWDG